MATWITKPWIEQALKCENVNKLPKIAKAQVLKFQEPSDKNNKNEVIGYISDKKLFVKAVFSEAAVGKFKRDNPSTAMLDIRGGLIFIKEYTVDVSVDCSDLDSVEFVIKVNEFKFAGGEGNTQFGSDIIDSCTYPPLHASLMKLWRLSQVNTLLRDTSCHDSAGLDQSLTCVTDVGQIESSLLKNHEYVFITEDMEQKLAEIPEWKASYCPQLSCNTSSNIQSGASQNRLQSHPASTADQGSLGCALQGAQSCLQNERHIPIIGISVHCREDSSLIHEMPKSTEGPLPGESISFVSASKAKGFRENAVGKCSEESGGQGAHTPVPTSSSERLLGSTHSNGKQLNLNIPDKQVLLEAQTARKYGHPSKPGGRPTVECDWCADSSSVLDGDKQVNREKVRLDSTPTREEEADTSMEETVICDSQVPEIIQQPLKGLVADMCSSSSESLQQKGSGEESYSILQRKSGIGEVNAFADHIVPCSSNSEESDYSQPLQNIMPFKNVSLSDSQLDILLEGEDNVSVDGSCCPPCSKTPAGTPQEGAFTQVKPKSSNTKTSNDLDPSSHLSKWCINDASEIRSASNYGIKAATSFARKVGNYRKDPSNNQGLCKNQAVVNNGSASKTGKEHVQILHQRPCCNPGIVSDVADANTKKDFVQTIHQRPWINPGIVSNVADANTEKEFVPTTHQRPWINPGIVSNVADANTEKEFVPTTHQRPWINPGIVSNVADANTEKEFVPTTHQRPWINPGIVSNVADANTNKELVQTKHQRPCCNPGIVSNVADANTKKELVQTKHQRPWINPGIVSNVADANTNKELVQTKHQRPCCNPGIVSNVADANTKKELVQTKHQRPWINPGIVSNVADANTNKELVQTKHGRPYINPRIVNNIVGSNVNEEHVKAKPKETATSYLALGDFDKLLSQNTWSVSQTKERETAEINDREQRLSGKRKRSPVEAALPTHTCSPPKQTRHDPAVSNRRSSPDSTSGSFKSSNSCLSQCQLPNNSPDVSLTQAVELYSQQDSLVLDNSDSAGRESKAETTDSEGDLIALERVMCDGHETPAVQRDRSPSPSILTRSTDEPCTLETPPFDSLPSFQPVASTPQQHKMEACDPSGSLCSFVQEYWREKKRKRRRTRFNWFSDDY